jgi:hypothetical protein
LEFHFDVLLQFLNIPVHLVVVVVVVIIIIIIIIIVVVVVVVINNQVYNGYFFLDSCLVGCSEIVHKSLDWETMVDVSKINAVCFWKIR